MITKTRSSKKHALWDHSGYFWHKAKFYDSSGSTSKGWVEGTLDIGFEVSHNIDKVPPTRRATSDERALCSTCA